MERGRPTKYKEEYCETVIPWFKEGWSIEEVAAELEVVKSTLYEWMDKHQDFSNAVKRGVQMSEAWWRREGREALRDKDFSYTGWYMNMKNRFGWADKQEHDHTSKGEKVSIGVQFFSSEGDEIE